MGSPFRGMLLPLPTVFDERGAVDEPLMRELVEYYVGAGVDTLFVNGSFGQGPAMTPDERRRMAELVIGQVRARVPVIVHIGTADPYTTIALGRHAMEKKADGIGMVGPYYYADRNPAEIRLHFKMIGAELDAPTLIYNNTRYQGYPIGPALMAQIASDSPQVFGAKLAMGGIDEAGAYRAAVGREFSCFALASVLFPGMVDGTIAGVINPPLALAPEIGVALVRAIDAHDYTRALALQQAVNDFHSVVLAALLAHGRGIFLPGLRAAGFKVRMYPRWPTPPLPEGLGERLHEAVRKARAVSAADAAARKAA